MMELFDDECIPLEVCEHIFHTNCLKQYITDQIDNRKVNFKCPDQECKKQLMINDFRDILDQKYHDKFLDYSLANFVDTNNEDACWCPTADCKYVFLLDDKPDNNNFRCPQCNKHYCLNCKVEYHKEQSCKEFQISNKKDENDLKFEKYVKGKKYKQCPHCSYWVEKTEGCYNMTCRCGHTFCYVCGGPTENYFCKTCTEAKRRGDDVGEYDYEESQDDEEVELDEGEDDYIGDDDDDDDEQVEVYNDNIWEEDALDEQENQYDDQMWEQQDDNTYESHQTSDQDQILMNEDYIDDDQQQSQQEEDFPIRDVINIDELESYNEEQDQDFVYDQILDITESAQTLFSESPLK